MNRALLIFLGLFFLVISYLISVCLKDRQTLRKRASEKMSKDLWSEIEMERNEGLEKRRRFRDVLLKKKKNNGRGSMG